MATTVITTIPALCYSMNFPDITVTATGSVTVVLKKGANVVLTELYKPSSSGKFVIKLRKLLTSLLSISIPSTSVFIQAEGYADFILTIDGVDHSFRLIKGGVKDVIADYPAFFSANFLTSQKMQKEVKYFEPTNLTYYSAIETWLRAKTTWTDLSNVGHTEEIIVAHLPAGALYTIDTTYDRIRQMFSPAARPTYIDLYVDALTYVQRFILVNLNDQFDDVFLFENSIGGIDCVRFTGQLEETPSSDSQSAIFNDIITEYGIDYKLTLKKYTGYQTGLNEATQVIAFFNSYNRYLIKNDIIRRINVTKINGSRISGQLNVFDFEFQYADEDGLVFVDRAEWKANETRATLAPPNPDFSLDFGLDFLITPPSKKKNSYGF